MRVPVVENRRVEFDFRRRRHFVSFPCGSVILLLVFSRCKRWRDNSVLCSKGLGGFWEGLVGLLAEVEEDALWVSSDQLFSDRTWRMCCPLSLHVSRQPRRNYSWLVGRADRNVSKDSRNWIGWIYC